MCQQTLFPFFFPAEEDTKPSPQTTYLVPEQRVALRDKHDVILIPPSMHEVNLLHEQLEPLLGRLCMERIQKEFWQHHRMVPNQYGTLEIKPIEKWTIALAAAGIISTRSFLDTNQR